MFHIAHLTLDTYALRRGRVTVAQGTLAEMRALANQFTRRSAPRPALRLVYSRAA